MYEGNNPTALKSQQWLGDTLIDLMEEKRIELIEYLCDYDEDFMMAYMEGEEPSVEEIKELYLKLL